MLSSPESVKLSPPIIRRPGQWNFQLMACGTDTPLWWMASPMVLTLEYLASTAPSCCQTTTQSTPLLLYIAQLWITNSWHAVTSALSPATNWKPTLVLSKPLCCLLSQKPQSQASTVQSMISHTHTTPLPGPHPSTPKLTAMSSHAPGEHFPQLPSLSCAFPLAPRPQYGMLVRPTGPSLPLLPSGLAWSFIFVEKTSLQLIPATTLVSHWPEEFMAWSLMPAWTYFEGMALVPLPSGWMIIYSSGSHMCTSLNTTGSAQFGSKTYKLVEGTDKMVVGYGRGERTYQMAQLRSLMRTVVLYLETCPTSLLNPLKTSTLPMLTPTLTKFWSISEYGGNPPNQPPSKQRSHISVSAGTYVHAWSICWTRKKSNTWAPLQNGRRSICITSSTPKDYMGSCSMLCWSSLQGEPTSPAWRPCLPHSTTVLSFCTHPHGTPHLTFNGGNNSSATQASQGPSCHPATQLTTGCSQTRALGLGLQSQLDPGGMHGGSPLGGSPREETSSGLRQLASSCLSLAYACHHTKESMLWSTGTTMGLLRDGGRDPVPTNPLTGYSNTSLSYWKLATGLYTQSMFQVRKTPLMPPQGDNTPPATSYSGTLLSLLRSSPSSSMFDPSELARKAALKPLVQAQADAEGAPIPSKPREPKQCKPLEAWMCDTLIPPTITPPNKKPAPYPPSLTPIPSISHLHCLAKDRLRLRLPTHPLLPAQGHSVLSKEEHKRTKDVMPEWGVVRLGQLGVMRW